MKSAFAEVAGWATKYSIIPILPNEKRPGEYRQGKWIGMMAWQQYAERLPAQHEIERWIQWPHAGVGLMTGKLSGIVALDFDNREDLRKELEKILPPSPVKKIGAKGYTAFYAYNGEVNKKWNVKGETVLELLSDGRQTVLPPTLHPSGIQYKWESKDLSNGVVLPKLSPELITAVDNFFAAQDERKNTTPSFTPQLISGTDLDKALTYISSDHYDTWIKVGMALYHEQGGFELWDRWSQGSEKYNAAEMPKKWASFSNCNRVHVGSVFYLAQQNGYKKEWVEPPGIEIALGKKEKNLSLPEDLLLSCPGLPGRIAHWLLSTMVYHHPAIAVAAALATVGALKGHRVQGESGLRTNLYLAALAPSGSGKSEVLGNIQKLLRASGVDMILGGEPVSDSGLLKSLSNAGGRRLIAWDEFGIALGEMTGVKANIHKTAIMKILMRLFSDAQGVFRGKEYADHEGKQKRQDIDQPCLSILGVSTPQRFYDALSSGHALDGFFPRWLIVEVNDPFPARRKVGHVSVPEDLINDINKIEALETNVTGLKGMTCTEIVPKTVKFSPVAAIEIEALADYVEGQKKASYGNDEGMEGVWCRVVEQVCKVALVVEDSTEEISLSSVQWARAFVLACTEGMGVILGEKIADNDHERLLNRIVDLISKHPEGLTQNIITRKTQRIKSKRERQDILETLVEGGRIVMEKVTTKGRNSTIYKIA